MPDESCRNCGYALEAISLCSLCRKANRQICLSCFRPTLEQIHTDCLSAFFHTQHEKLGAHCIGEEKIVHVLSPNNPEGIKIPSPSPVQRRI